MIGKLTGTTSIFSKDTVLVETNGVGYVVYVQPNAKLRLQGNQTLYIYTVVKENDIELFGFETIKERAFFELLLSVSGIGPKTALLIVNTGIDNVEQAIKKADAAFFTSIPRIGKKNGQKIIIELKNKIGGEELDLTSDFSQKGEIADALVSMGFSTKDVRGVLEKLYDTEKSIEDNIKIALKHLAKK